MTERRARHHPTTSSSLRASSEGVSSRFPWWNMVNHAAPQKNMATKRNKHGNKHIIIITHQKLWQLYWKLYWIFIECWDGSCSKWFQLIKSKVRRPNNSEGLQLFFFVAFTLLSDERQGNAKATPRQRAMLSAVSWWTGPKSTTCCVKVGRFSDFLYFLWVFCYDHNMITIWSLNITEYHWYVLTEIFVNHFGRCSDTAIAFGSWWVSELDGLPMKRGSCAIMEGVLGHSNEICNELRPSWRSVCFYRPLLSKHEGCLKPTLTHLSTHSLKFRFIAKSHHWFQQTWNNWKVSGCTNLMTHNISAHESTSFLQRVSTKFL